MWFISRFYTYLTVQQRNLTPAEIVLAQSVFAHHIDYSRVRIIAHRAVLPSYALSPNGHIYFNPSDYCANFAQQALPIQSWFIHEMVHVWQYQSGMRVLVNALLNRRYTYVLKTGKSFLDYGVEQQAQMVQDYFLNRAKGQCCADLAAYLPFKTG